MQSFPMKETSPLVDTLGNNESAEQCDNSNENNSDDLEVREQVQPVDSTSAKSGSDSPFEGEDPNHANTDTDTISAGMETIDDRETDVLSAHHLDDGAKKINQADLVEMSFETSPLPPSYITDESVNSTAAASKLAAFTESLGESTQEANTNDTQGPEPSPNAPQPSVATEPPVPILEASLVEDPPPIYDAVMVHDDVAEDEDPPRSWFKRHQKYVYVGLGLLVGSVSVALGTVFGSPDSSTNDSTGVYQSGAFFSGQSLSPSISLQPSTTIAPSWPPTLHPTFMPSKAPSFPPTSSPSKAPSFPPTSSPSLRPTSKPSISPSLSPSTYLATLAWEQDGEALVGDAANDQSGYAVSLAADGNSVAIGSPGIFNNEDRPGYVKVYQRYSNLSNWELVITLNGTALGDRFGASVSMSRDGTTLAVGSPGRWQAADRPGYVRIYSRNEDMSWQQLGDEISGRENGDHLGVSVSLSSDGSILATGSPWNSGYSGNARVFELNGEGTNATWNQLGIDIIGESADDNSGFSVSLSGSGDTLAIGAPHNKEQGENAGHVRVYYWDTNSAVPSWKVQGQDIDGEAGDWVGGEGSVALSEDGTILAIGAVGFVDDRPGYVSMYHWTGSLWEQRQTIRGEHDADHFGRSVCLSGDGTVLAVGAYGNSDNGYGSGYVQIYHFSEAESKWTKLGRDIGGASTDDNSGWSVSLSREGVTVAIGSYLNNDNGIDSGHVRVFSFDY